MAHQHAQGALGEITALNAGRSRPAVGGKVGPAGIVPFLRLLPHPGGARQAANGASLTWPNALVGWARRGEARHLTVTAGAALLLALAATLAAGV
ncbi:hypothetical protein [Azospirillum picis]|uniref:Uncharacterized protein n=1 Tax=Azospirillum picis TaxID=488438 RepID=A0ABU0MPI0_9PROT|nr:hypothetical protein [Azospirillum picis]MBP2301544.1 hypothetical protein [Azospirillum picis]MDQ0535376.1 hypothetical protein [Azospirillum picis]